MNDDEVKQWLSEEEQWALNRAVKAYEAERAMVSNPDGSPRMTYASGPWQASALALRTLAETRKALAACEDRNDLKCPLCGLGPQGSHDETCIFATMPRPK